MTRRIYLDHNASTPVAPAVREAMLPWLSGRACNPSSLHRGGREAAEAIETARRAVGARFGVGRSGVTFCSGATEAANTVLRGVRGHVVVSSVEHPCVIEPVLALARSGHITLDRVLPEQVTERVRPDTSLVAVMRVNNETGRLYPTAEIAAEARRIAPGVVVLVDAVQAVNRVPVTMDALGADYALLSGHKIGAPMGVGALLVRTGGSRPEPLLLGGGQEGGRRAGTPNLPGIVGLGAACALGDRDLAETGERLISGLITRIGGLHEHGNDGPRVPGVYNFRVDGIDAEELLLRLDMAGIQASSGSACASGSRDPSHVLLAMGLSPQDAHGSIRLSLGTECTHEDVDRVVEVFAALTSELRR